MSTEKRGDALITRLVERCAADERIVAAFLGGSRVRGGADDLSDYDISVIVVDASYGELIAEKRRVRPPPRATLVPRGLRQRERRVRDLCRRG